MQRRILEIPLNKLVRSDANVRKTHRERGVEELAASIAVLGGVPLQSLSVRPVLNAEGAETGKYRVPGGGRRLAALQLLAARKQIAKNTPIPCVLSEGDEEEVSLAENVFQEPLHPADQFEAFKRLSDRGLGEADIAARFGVKAETVRQRLRLAVVSPVLMQAYRDEKLRLDQLMAFAVTDDQVLQEQVYANLGGAREPFLIRRMLTEKHVAVSDARVRLVGIDAYLAAGGTVLRDLFTEDGGGWLEDTALLDRLVLEKLEGVAATVKAEEGWLWAKAVTTYPAVHDWRRVYPGARDLSTDDQARLDGLTAEYEDLSAAIEAGDAAADAEARLEALDAEIDAFTEKTAGYAPDDVAHAGVFVVLGRRGEASIERGFVRPQDEREPEVVATPVTAAPSPPAGPAAEEDDERPLSNTLVLALMTERTMALRHALGQDTDVALTAVVHALALRTFYHASLLSCLDLTPRSTGLSAYAHGIEDSVGGRAVAERHDAWARRLPKDAPALWANLAPMDRETQLALLAHCAALTVLSVGQPGGPTDRSADTLAGDLSLDMTTYWKPTAAAYLSRVSKAGILDAVREGVSEEAARRLDGLKKDPMVEAAEGLLAGTSWLPAVLRTGAAVAREKETVPPAE